jgi:hypothetical protein
VDIKVRKVHYFFHNEEDQLVVILNADIFGDDEEKYFYFLSPDQSDSQFYLSKVDDGTGNQEGEECCLRLSTDNEYVFGWTGFPEYGFSDGQTLLIPAESATQAQEILQKAQEESQEFQNWIKQANDSLSTELQPYVAQK